MNKFAVIDLGSNSARMGIYSDENNFCEHYRKRVHCRLAEGLNKDNLLKEVPMQRTISALKDFRSYMDSEGIKDVIAVATESLRRAENSDIFISNVKKEANIDLKVIDGEAEATYGMFAASTSIDSENYYVLDTGGGSAEISLVENSTLKNFVSLPCGAVVLNEQFSPDTKGTRDLNLFIKEKFTKLSFIKNNNYPVVALGGSVKALAAASGLHEKIDGKKIDFDTVASLYKQIHSTPLDERCEKFGIEDERKDIIVAGLSPLLTLMELTGSKEVYFCTKSIRDGIAAEYIRNHK